MQYIYIGAAQMDTIPKYLRWEKVTDESIRKALPYPGPTVGDRFIHFDSTSTDEVLVFTPHPLDIWRKYSWECKLMTATEFAAWSQTAK